MIINISGTEFEQLCLYYYSHVSKEIYELNDVWKLSRRYTRKQYYTPLLSKAAADV